MELGQYKKRKKKKVIRMQKVGDAVFVISTVFDPWTGDVDKEISEALPREAVVKRREQLVEQVAELDEVLKDIDNA